MGIFSRMKKLNENYQKNTKLGRWAVENQKKQQEKLKKRTEDLKEKWKDVKDAPSEAKKVWKEEMSKGTEEDQDTN